MTICRMFGSRFSAINAQTGLFLLGIIGILVDHVTCQGFTQCDVTYLGREKGAISSPNFPFNYYNDRICKHNILFHNYNTTGLKLCFLFKRFRLENINHLCRDTLKFPGDYKYCDKGVNQHSPVGPLGNVFNDDFCWDITSTTFTIEFSTDSTGKDVGFYAEFELMPESGSSSVASQQLQKMHKGESQRILDHNDIRDVAYINRNRRSILKKQNISIGHVRKNPHSFLTSWSFGHKLKQGKHFARDKQIRQRLMANDSRSQIGIIADGSNGIQRHGQSMRRSRRNINNMCAEDEERCWIGSCIRSNQICDGKNDCGDNSDESYQHARCQADIGIGGCDFEGNGDKEICGFESDHWDRDVQSSNGPRYDHTIGELYGPGHFMFTSYIFGQEVVFSKLENLEARNFDRCLSFWYFMSGSVGSLTLQFEVENTSNQEVKAWYREGDQTNQWNQGQVAIPESVTVVKVIFKSDRKGQYGQIGLDDIALLDVPCYSSDISCTFELGQCGWKVDIYSETNWVRWTGPTDTDGTGPETDGDGNPQGHYMYLDSKTNSSLTGRLISRPVTAPHPDPGICIVLQYHMYGEDIRTLRVLLKDHEGAERQLWEKGNDQGESWYKVNIPASAVQAYQIIIEGSSQGLKSNMAVDNVYVHSAFCLAEVISTTTTAAPNPTCVPGAFQCRDGMCIDGKYVCDGRADCADMSDEENCSNNSGNLGIIVGVTTSVLVFVIVLVTIMLIQYKKQTNRPGGQSSRRMFSVRRDASVHADWDFDDDSSFTAPADLGVPPPLYEEAWEGHSRRPGSVISMDGPVPRITISLSWEPPPAYHSDISDINISVYPSTEFPAQPPIYTVSDSYDQPPPQYQPNPHYYSFLQRIRRSISGEPLDSSQNGTVVVSGDRSSEVGRHQPSQRQSRQSGQSNDRVSGERESSQPSQRQSRQSGQSINRVAGEIESNQPSQRQSGQSGQSINRVSDERESNQQSQNQGSQSRQSGQSIDRVYVEREISQNNTSNDPDAIQTLNNNENDRSNNEERSSYPKEEGSGNQRSDQLHQQSQQSQAARRPKNKRKKKRGTRVRNPEAGQGEHILWARRPLSGPEIARRPQDDSLSLCGNLEPREIDGVRSARRSRDLNLEMLDDNLSLAEDIQHPEKDTDV